MVSEALPVGVAVGPTVGVAVGLGVAVGVPVGVGVGAGVGIVCKPGCIHAVRSPKEPVTPEHSEVALLLVKVNSTSFAAAVVVANCTPYMAFDPTPASLYAVFDAVANDPSALDTVSLTLSQ